MGESVKFKIGLSGTYWNRPPQFKIILSGKEFVSDVITKSSGDVEYHEFTADMEEGEQLLEIQLLGKEFSDVKKDADGGVAEDQLLNIESIEVDGIDLGNLKYSASVYYPLEPQAYNDEIISELKECVNLGWNGSYTIKFQSPFYLWLLETL